MSFPDDYTKSFHQYFTIVFPILYNTGMEKKDFNELTIRPIAHIETDFPTKFGIPRQSDIVKNLYGRIVFEKEYRKEGILRGLEGFSHIWVIWGFSAFEQQKEFSPTIRPPKLGGNTRVGVFASRSPNRPNPLGLSALKIEKIDENCIDKPVIIVSGADLMDGTPIYDIKPYLPAFDSIADAKEGYTKETKNIHLDVILDDSLKEKIPEEKREAVLGILSQDPRPGFQHDEKKIYGFFFSGMEIRFHVPDEKTVIVDSIEPKVKTK